MQTRLNIFMYLYYGPKTSDKVNTLSFQSCAYTSLYSAAGLYLFELRKFVRNNSFAHGTLIALFNPVWTLMV